MSDRSRQTVVGAASVVFVALVVGVVVLVTSRGGGGTASPSSTSAPRRNLAHGGHVMTMDDEPVPTRPLTAEEAAERDQQLGLARAAVPGLTVADAVAAGYESDGMQTSEFHLVRRDIDQRSFDPAEPPMLLATSDRPDGEILALVYWVDADADPEGDPPAGFAGPEDQWHYHGAACRIDGRIAPGDDYPADECRRDGGTVATAGGYMLHVWVVPGRDNPRGLFAVSP